MLKEIAILALFITLASAGVLPKWEGRVIGGNTAFNGQFPWIASVRTLRNEHYCGGTIVTSNHVISAAHCFVGSLARDVQIVVGAHHISWDGAGRYLIQTLTSHESYNLRGEMEYDVAVLRTFDPILEIPQRVQRIPLVTGAPRAGEVVTLAGWGHIIYGQGQQTQDPDYLQYMHKRIIDASTCNSRMQRILPTSTLCTESPVGQGACMGDSGGPLTNQNNQLVGIVSWGIPCALGLPDMYGNVYNLRSWILPRIV